MPCGNPGMVISYIESSCRYKNLNCKLYACTLWNCYKERRGTFAILENASHSMSTDDSMMKAHTHLERNPELITVEISKPDPEQSMNSQPKLMTANVNWVVEHFLQLFDDIRLVAKNDEYELCGRQRLAATVRNFVDRGMCIGIVLPAFPSKSPNQNRKVLGALPDRGEELALELLENFCKNVEEFYPPGAAVVIFSDGRVFADLLHIPVGLVEAYNKECKRLVTDAGHSHITFDSMENHIRPDPHHGQVMLIEELEQLYGDPNSNLEERLEIDINLRNTFESIKSFIQLDLEPSKTSLGYALGLSDATMNSQGQASEGGSISTVTQQSLQPASTPGEESHAEGSSTTMTKKRFKYECSKIAKKMILRNMAFSNLVDKSYPDFVRFSIHGHNNSGPKYGVALLPLHQGRPTTPWHNVIVEDDDGNVYAIRRELVDTAKFEMYQHPVYDRPWGFKEKSSRIPFNVPLQVDAIKEDTANLKLSPCYLEAMACLPISIEPLHPNFGVMITPASKPGDSVPWPFDIPPVVLRRLTNEFSFVVLRGFQDVSSHEQLADVAARLGRIVYWPFGGVLDVREKNAGRSGSVCSPEALPMHFDGIFKYQDATCEEIVSSKNSDVPGFLLFYCVTPPSPHDVGGETLFVETRSLLQRLSKEQYSLLSSVEAEYYTPANHQFGGRWTRTSLVSSHPSTGEPIVRYHEPWPEAKSAQTWVAARPSENTDATKFEQAQRLLQQLVYSKSFCYTHKWMQNDLVLVDNHAMLHGRTAGCTGSPRHLRRVHFH